MRPPVRKIDVRKVGVAKIGFLATAHEPGFLRRMSRLRWARRFPDHEVVELSPDASAREAICDARWVVVFDETALPVPGGPVEPTAGRVIRVLPRSPAGPPVAHTLRELEDARFGPDGALASHPTPAIAFAAADFPAAAGETVAQYARRLRSPQTPFVLSTGVSALVFDEERGDRAEVTRRFPNGIRRLLDVGCGIGLAGETLGRERRSLHVTGIEPDPASAGRARRRLDDVREDDAARALDVLSRSGERFDAFLFADVLEHLDDPIAVLALARAIAEPDATLVASVPNVGHVSIVRDLVCGRFDPVPAGLADAGHLRWFTRATLEEWLDEAGWVVESIDGLPGAPAPDADEFLRTLSGWPGLDGESLRTYQWVVVARAR